MIFVTGDTHIPIDINKLSSKRFPQQREMTKDDYVIICGDFGGVWDGSNEEKYWLKWLKNRNFSLLFVDGNHENFAVLNSLPIIDFAGGKAHKVDEGIYHLMRGEVYTIEDKKFFVFGGGSSHDKECRREGVNWWEEEMPAEEEYKKAENNLKSNNFQFDYVITHSAPTSVQREIRPSYENNRLTDFLDIVSNKATYRKWFFGHYHIDNEVNEKMVAVFNKIFKIT